jgi:ActR/RegA family two-component response regulator
MHGRAQLFTPRSSWSAQSDDRTESPNPHVLIASPDELFHEAVKGALGQFHYSGTFVRSGADAVTSAHSHRSSPLFLDQSLPDLAGLEVARVLNRDSSERRFVLIGNSLTTSTTVEAMKLGAFTVLEKPVARSEIAVTIRAFVDETRSAARLAAHAMTALHGAARSVSERWAWHVLKGCDADRDLKTLGAWASFVGLSYSSLCEMCRLVAIQPLDARDLTRVLRALVQSHRFGCRLEELLDVSDRRTLRTLMIRAGLAVDRDECSMSVEQFLALQQFVPATNAGLAVLRALLLQ